MKLDIKSVLVGLLVGAALCVLLGGESEAQPYDHTPQIVPSSHRPPRYTAMAVGPTGTIYVLDGYKAIVCRVNTAASPAVYEPVVQLPPKQ